MGFLNNRIYTHESNDSVYWYDEAGDAFRLLIPFNAQAGDEWMVPVAHPWQPGSMLDTVIYHVDSVSQVTINGTPLRKLFVTRSTLDPLSGLWAWDSGSIIERLGDLLYLMPWLMTTCSDGFEVSGLVCYEDTEISWLNPLYTQCDLGVDTDEPILAPEFTVAPNPVDQGDAVRINMSGNPMGNARMEVMDATGRRIATAPVRAQMTEVTMPGSGLFLIIVDDGSGHISTKQVVVY